MKLWSRALSDLLASHRGLRSPEPRGPRRIGLLCDALEDRVTPSHLGALHELAAAVQVHRQPESPGIGAAGRATVSVRTIIGSANVPRGVLGHTTAPVSTSGLYGHGRTAQNPALQSALQTLRSDVQKIELASGTTVGELTTLRAAMQTLAGDGLSPTSYSALQSFENSLVTINASAPGSLTGNLTLLQQFQALYTSSPTTQETTDLSSAYNALAAAVTSAGVTSADIETINADWSAVLAASSSTSTASYPYFALVTGQGAGVCISTVSL